MFFSKQKVSKRRYFNRFAMQLPPQAYSIFWKNKSCFAAGNQMLSSGRRKLQIRFLAYLVNSCFFSLKLYPPEGIFKNEDRSNLIKKNKRS